jgi:protein-S-isoprenylcysteine O-methyltransferase Ste14
MVKLIARLSLPMLILMILILAVAGDLFSVNPFVIAGQLAGLAVTISARISFGRQKFNLTADPANGPLLRRGPYRIIRHPMYTGALLFILSTVLGHLLPLSAVIGVLVVFLLLFRIQVEENILSAHYPDYVEYTQGTKRVIPFVF